MAGGLTSKQQLRSSQRRHIRLVKHMSLLSNFQSSLRAVIIGPSGGIGRSLSELLINDPQTERVYLLGRHDPGIVHPKALFIHTDITSESSLEAAAAEIATSGKIDLLILATGLLHGENIQPEKSAKQITLGALQESFAVNCFGPALAAKYFLPLFDRRRKTAFAALSARVGSISDNRLGGWYAYRASKAALNMMLKTLSIEYARTHKSLTILGLHPGTVDTSLSEPFQGNVSEQKLFTPEFSAGRLLDVINQSEPVDSGSLVAWDGKKIPF